MKGRNPSYSRSRVIAWTGVLLLGLVWGRVRAGELGHQGKQGETEKRAEINFTTLSEQSAENVRPKGAGRERVRRPAARRMALPPGKTPVLPDSKAKQVEITDFSAQDTSFTAAGAPSGASPPPSASFQALPDNETAFNPDTHGAVGPSHVMTTLASQVRIQSRTGANLQTMSIDAFWASVGNPPVFDPRVLYDPIGQRWITTAISDPAGSNNASILIGVSATSNPTGSWHLRSVPVDTNSVIFPSSPNVGFTKDWITVSVPMFSETNFLFFSTDIWVFNKTNLYAGGVGQFTYFRYVNPAMNQDNALVPAVTMDPTYSTNFLVANWLGSAEGAGFFRLFSIGGPVNAPVFEDYEPGVTFNNGLFASLNAPWASYSPGDTNFAPQLGSSRKIYLGDARIQNVVFRNSTLWCTHHVFLPAGDTPTRASIQWFSMTPGGNIIHAGRYDDSSGVNFFAFPSLAVNANEDVLIGFSRFAANRFPSANYSFANSENLVLRTDVTLKAGENSFVLADPNDVTRWGDWSATVVDPLNDTDFWTIQEYAGSPGPDHWGTWWGRVSPPTDLTLAVTDSPDPVIAGGNVTYSLRVTNNALTVATGVTISNTLPVGAQFISAVPSTGTCTHNAGVVTCNFGDLDGEGNVSATIVATLNQSPTSTNTAVVFGFGPEEGLAADNTVKTTTAVNASADLAVLMSASPNPVTVSNNLTFLVVVTNRGPSAATGVALTNTLPPGVTFVSATPGAGQGSCSPPSGGLVSCNLGAVANAGSATVTVVVRPTAGGQITNRAHVAASLATLDPNQSNNTNSAVSRANAAPTMQFLNDRTMQEDGVLVLSFTVSDVETLATNLQVVALSSSQIVVPNANIMLDNAGGSRQMTITPAPNAFGTTIIRRIVTDADGASTTNEFTLTVSEVPDRPTISLISNVTTNEDSIVGPIPFTIDDAETPGSLTVSGSSSNPQLIPNANININPSSGLSRNVTLTPLPNSNGTANITLTVSDGALTTNRVFTVILNAVNDLPTITDITNRVVNEDTSTGQIAFTIGDVETLNTSLLLGRLSSNPTLVPTNNIMFGGSGANRNVTVTPATNEFGSATITVSVADGNGGSTNDSFQITVNPVNDPPTLDTNAPINIPEDAGLQVVTLTGITVGAGNEVQTNRITASVTSNPGLILNLSTNYTPPSQTGTLSFTPAPNSNGTAVITVTVNDGGASNNILVRTINVTVAAVNDAPTISDIADRGTLEDVATGQIPFVVGDVDSPLAALSFSGRCADTNLVPSANFQFNGSGSNWTVNITPAPNRFGTNTISIFVSDGSATNVDTFVLRVQAVNDLPTISSIGDSAVNEDVATNISFAIGDAETVADNLNLTASSTSPALFSSITFGGSGNSRSVNIVPAANLFGVADITVRVSDADGGTNSATFRFTVRELNDLPTLDFIADVTMNEDAGQQTIPLTGITTGAPNEVQPLSVTASAGGSGIVTGLQAIYSSGSSGTLRFTPVPNSNGVAAITVFVSDSQATNSRTFNAIIRSINDPPTISAIGNPQVLNEDVTTNIVFTVGDVETPPGQLLVQASSSNPELIDETGIDILGNTTSRTLVLTPLPNESGIAEITVTVTDGSNEMASTVFELEVRPVNDRPTITGLTDLTIASGAPDPVRPFTVSDPETPPGQLILSRFSSNPSLVTTNNLIIPPGTGTSRSLTIRPTVGQLGSSIIRIVVADGSGAGAGFATNEFVFSVVDATLSNAPPVISNIANTNVNEDLQLSISFTVGDTDNAPGTLELTATSSNPALLPVSRIDFGGGGGNRMVTLTPMANQTGSVTITITATDSYGAAASDSFVLTVNPVNDPPTLSGLPDLAVNEDSATGPLTVVVGDVDTPLASLNLTGSSGNIALVPNGEINVAGTGASRTVTITPVANQTGSVQITLTLSDGAGGTTNTAFILSVLPVNDPPTLNPIADLPNLPEDAGLQTVNLSGISAGGGENQPLIITATSSNLALVSTVNVNYNPGSSTGTVTFTPLPNANGTTVISVKVDDGQPQNSFVIRTFSVTVGSTNDGPTISNIADQTMLEDTVLTVPFTIGDVETAGLSLTLSATSSNTTLVAVTNIQFSGAGTARTITVIPTTNLFGTSLITVRVTDGVATNSDTFLLTVTATNDPPTLNPISNFQTNSAGGNPVHSIVINGISSGATNENQTLSFTSITSANTTLLPNPTVTYTNPNTNGTLVLRPNNAQGSSLVTVVLSDGSSTVTQTFLVTLKSQANALPTISIIGTQTLAEDTSSGSIPFTTRDAETTASSLTLFARSSNPSLLPTNNISFGAGPTNRTLTLSPVANRFGTAAITLTVVDAGSGSSNMTFTVNVTSVNDVPTLTGIADQTIGEDTATAALTFNVTDVETPAGNLAVTATSDSQTVVPNGNIVLGGSGTNRALVVRPAANQSGSARITVSVSDGSASTNIQFNVAVSPINDPPTLSDVVDQTINEDTSITNLTFTVGDVETAAGNLTPAATSSDTNLVPSTAFAFGGSGANRTLVITPAPNQFGTATITLSVSDGTNQMNTTFLLTVNATNDPPTLNAPGDRTIVQNAGPQLVALSGIGSGAPNEDQVLIVAASSSDPGVIPNPTIDYTSPEATGTLSFRPVAGAVGSAVITVVVNDGQAQNNVITRTFNVTVTSAPSIAAVANQVINEDRTGSTINITITDADSTLSSVTLGATSSNPTLVPNATLSPGGAGGSRSLVITPAADQYGFSTITLTAQDPDGNVNTTDFLLTVAPVNDAPTLNQIGSPFLPPNAGLQIVNLTGISSGVANELQVLTVTAASGNPALIPNPGVNYLSPAGSGTLSFTPAANATGAVVITVRVIDDGGKALGGANEITRQFTVSIGGVPPQLRIDRIGANVIVSWPTNNADGWSLRSGTSLSNPGSWNAVMTQPSVVLGRYTVTNAASGPARYYRLCSGCSTGMPQDATLSIRRSANRVIVSWSSSAGDFALESTPSLSAPVDWSPVGNVPVEADGKFSVTLDVEGTPRFFRLRGR